MNQAWIYFDNSATTALCPEAKASMTEAMEIYGNPSSLHGAGQAAHTLLEKARGQVAAALGVRLTRPSELIFTASGTEANNQAIFGSVYAKPRRIGNRIITTDCEHPSVAAAMERLEKEGFGIIRIPTRNGVLDTDELPAAKATLSAATMTYVAALASSLASLLRLLLIFNGRSRR